MNYPLGHNSSGRPHAELIALACHEDPRGRLFPLDFQALPFQPARVFFVESVPPGTLRGEHAHKHQQQALICLKGTVSVAMQVEGRTATVELGSPKVALLMESGVWSAQRFVEQDSVLLVLASGEYDPMEYLHATS